MTTKRLPDSVLWSEGMLLSPQHMQQNDIYWHEHLTHRLACLTPHYWGVRRLVAVLIQDKLVVSELECLLPNGVAVEYPGPKPSEWQLEANLKGLAAGKSLRLWLLVRERGSEAAKHNNEARRYDSYIGSETPDENTGEGDLPVGRLQIRLEVVLSETSPSAGLGACPLLEVTRGANDVCAIAPYYPPMLQAEASRFLGEQGLLPMLAKYHETWWAKAQEFAREPSGYDEAGRLNVEGVRNQRVARHLASALPQFAVALGGESRPFDLYRSLALVVGQMAGFAEDPLPLKMDAYNHEDCLPQFLKALQYIDNTLEAESRRIAEARNRKPKPAYEMLPFEAVDERGFARKLPEGMNGTDGSGELIVEIKLRAGQTLKQVGHWLNQADIAEADLIAPLRRRRVPGAQVRQLGAEEIRRLSLPPLADMFAIRNRAVDLDESGARPLFAAGQALAIQGQSSQHAPAAIVLYRKLTTDEAAAGADQHG